MDNRYFMLLSLFLMGLIGFIGVVLPESVVADPYGELGLPKLDGVLYDSGGHGIAYYNKTVIGEAGNFVPSGTSGSSGMYWVNGSGSFALYSDDDGLHQVFLRDFDRNGFTSSTYMRGFNAGSDSFVGSLWASMMAGAFTAIVVGAVAGAALLSVTVLGSGEKEYGVKVIVTVGFFSLLWVLVSAVGVSWLISIPVFGFVFYMLLSFAYYLGVWGEINN